MAEEITPTQQVLPSITPIYVGDLSPNVTEAQLLELFKTCGVVLSARICRDVITRRSLGYGYVNFQHDKDAEKALETLNFKELDGRHLRLMYQQRDPSARYSGSNNIFVKNLGDGIDSKGLHDLFKAFGSILSCKVMSNDDGTSRRYGFVHFKSDDAATGAIQKLNKTTEQSAPDESLYVAHFIRRNARIAALMLNFTNVYIKQVLPTVNQDAIEKFFSKFGGITSACARKDTRGRVFAFCNFSSHEDAAKAIEAIHDKPVDGLTADDEQIYVQRAQPRNERLVELRSKHMQRQSPANLYVRNISPDFKDEDLRELFSEFGEIKSCRVMVDEKGAGRGFGFVSFTQTEQTNAAVREMHGRMIGGKPLVVNIAQRRDQRLNMLQRQWQKRIEYLIKQHTSRPFVAGLPGQQGPGQQGNNNRRNNNNNNNNQQQQQQRAGHSNAHASNSNAAPAVPAVPAHRQMVGHNPRTPPYAATRTPQVSPTMAPDSPALAPISINDLRNLPDNERNIALGERLYTRVAEIDSDRAPKITGMFLEMKLEDAFELLEDPIKLESKVREAISVLQRGSEAQN